MRKLASSHILNGLMPILILYVIVGTIAQKYIGLYEATNQFFLSPIFFLHGVPLPGMPVFIGFLIINLLAHVIYKSPWNFKKSGIIITHIGVLFLLVGGLFPAIFAQEGYIDLAEEQSSMMVSDYHKREFSIETQDDRQILRLSFSDILDGGNVIPPDDRFDIDILEMCQNCAIQKRDNPDESFHGMAQHMKLLPKPPALVNEENMAGLTIKISGTESDGVYTILEDVPVHPEISINDEVYKLSLGKETRPLPFEVTLLDFQRELYPGTEKPKAYSSHIRIQDGEIIWEGIVSMNSPLRYKGYALFQSSFIQTSDGQERSVIAVVYNPVRSFPYLAGLMISLGVLIHLFLRHKSAPPKSKRYGMTSLIICLSFCFLFLLSGKAEAHDNVDHSSDWKAQLDLKSFEKIPVLHEGRLMPMDSYARIVIKTISGDQRKAVGQLVSLLFDPVEAVKHPLIQVQRAETRSLLELDKQDRHLYRYDVLSVALAEKQDILSALQQQNSDSLNSAQKDFLKIHRNVVMVRNLLNALALFEPIRVLPEDLPPEFQQSFGQKDVLTYINTQDFHADIEAYMSELIVQKGTDLDAYTDQEQALAFLSFVLKEMRASGRRSFVPSVIKGSNPEILHDPWSIVLRGQGSPASREQFKHWERMAEAFNNQDAKAWNEAVSHLIALQPEHSRFKIELLYNDLNPFYLSALFYGLAIGVLILSFIFGFRFDLAASFILALGLLIHGFGILVRVIILSRPPVGTLYESILFVGFIVVVYAAIMFWRYRATSWLWIGAGGGILLQVIGFSHNHDALGMSMLSAVLNTNFWLTTHVLCITAGYAFCILTSLLAHAMLFLPEHQNVSHRNHPKKNQDMSLIEPPMIEPTMIEPTMIEPTMIEPTMIEPTMIESSMKRAGLLALFFTILGTVLGGIWADQSWGRFWGWDPKENGALLIILWLIWFLHGDVTKTMRGRIVLSGLAYLSVIVGLSWFGVNLLNVGLHSYGFTDTMAISLLAFTIFETVLIALLAIRKPHANEHN